MNKNDIRILFEKDGIVLKCSGSDMFISDGKQTFRLYDQPYEPCLYIEAKGSPAVTVHGAFLTAELASAAKTGKMIQMITGNEYGIQDVCRLILKAAGLGRDLLDLSYAECCLFADYLEGCDAFSEQTAADLAPAGLKNPKSLNPFIHSKKVRMTKNGWYYLVTK